MKYVLVSSLRVAPKSSWPNLNIKNFYYFCITFTVFCENRWRTWLAETQVSVLILESLDFPRILSSCNYVYLYRGLQVIYLTPLLPLPTGAYVKVYEGRNNLPGMVSLSQAPVEVIYLSMLILISTCCVMRSDGAKGRERCFRIWSDDRGLCEHGNETIFP
jgi:hypothetical protein